MTVGQLIQYLSGKYSGLPYHLTVVPAATIGGYGNPKSLTTLLSVEHDLQDALLTLTVSGNELKSRKLVWKVSLGRVTLTREFRPQVITYVGSTSYASVVFDVSQILTKKGKYELKISCESAETINVDAISVTGFVPIDGSRVELRYLAGVAAIAPQETIQINIDNEEAGEAGIIMVLSAPSRTAVLEVSASGKKLGEFRGVFGTDEIIFKGKLPEPKSSLIIKHLKESAVHYPKWALIHEVLVYRPITPGPVIDVKAELKEENKVIIELINFGSSPVKDLLVVGISAGMMAFREVIDELKSGENVTIVKEVEKIAQPFIVRAIYYGMWGQTVKSVKLQ